MSLLLLLRLVLWHLRYLLVGRVTVDLRIRTSLFDATVAMAGMGFGLQTCIRR